MTSFSLMSWLSTSCCSNAYCSNKQMVFFSSPKTLLRTPLGIATEELLIDVGGGETAWSPIAVSLTILLEPFTKLIDLHKVCLLLAGLLVCHDAKSTLLACLPHLMAIASQSRPIVLTLDSILLWQVLHI